MRAEQITCQIALSFVFDPFDDIRLFLDCLAQGSDAQLLIHDEVHFHFLRASETDVSGRFRLGLWNTLGQQCWDDQTYDLTPVWDVMVERNAFVRSFYQAVMDVWGKPDGFTFRRAWFNFTEDEDPYVDENGLSPPLLKFRSPELDRFPE